MVKWQDELVIIFKRDCIKILEKKSFRNKVYLL